MLINNIIGNPLKINWDISKPDGTYRKLMDSNKIKKQGWESKISLEKGIETAYKDFLKTLS